MHFAGRPWRRPADVGPCPAFMVGSARGSFGNTMLLRYAVATVWTAGFDRVSFNARLQSARSCHRRGGLRLPASSGADGVSCCSNDLELMPPTGGSQVYNSAFECACSSSDRSAWWCGPGHAAPIMAVASSSGAPSHSSASIIVLGLPGGQLVT